MNEAIGFLHALAQALSTSTLYMPGHPATKRSAEHLWQAVRALLAVDSHPIFLFLGTAPVYAGRALHELRDWHHSSRLAVVGVQRLEFDGALTLESVGQLIVQLSARLAAGGPVSEESPIAGVLFGMVAVQEQGTSADGSEGSTEDAGPVLRVDLADELAAMHFVLTEAARGVVARAEADAVVRILAAIVEPHHLPQVNTDDADRYRSVQAVNTALLAMTASAAMGLDGSARHRLGVVALLHDIGMALLPAELVNAEELSAAERVQVETHTTLGASLLLRQGGAGFDLAATVAYEHHLRPDGAGYPARRFAPPSHWASRMVACCAAFTALRAARPFRAGWPTERVAHYIEEGAGTAFDSEIAMLVSSLVTTA